MLSKTARRLLRTFTPEHLVIDNKLALFIYGIIITTVKEDSEEEINCGINLEFLVDSLNTFDPIEVEKAVEYLEELRVISVDGAGIINVGYRDGKKISLYEADTEDVSKPFSTVRDYLQAWLDATVTKGRKALVSHFMSSLDKLEAQDDWNAKDYINFFALTYAAVNQVEHREFMAKEYGQMATMYKLYGYSELFNMIVEYVGSVELYHKHPATIATFLFSKDIIYGKLYAVSSREKLREKDINHDF